MKKRAMRMRRGSRRHWGYCSRSWIRMNLHTVYLGKSSAGCTARARTVSYTHLGERIGYLVIPSEMDESANVFQAATIANRVLGCVNAPSLMQRVIKRCVDANVKLEAYDRNRNLLYNGLKECGFSCIKPEGAFYLFVKSPVENEKEFCEVCKQYNVLVVPGSSFACPGYVRIDVYKRQVLHPYTGQTIYNRDFQNKIPLFFGLSGKKLLTHVSNLLILIS